LSGFNMPGNFLQLLKGNHPFLFLDLSG